MKNMLTKRLRLLPVFCVIVADMFNHMASLRHNVFFE